MRLDDQIIITTPEGVDVEITLAGLGSRAIAGLLDLTIEVCILVALFLVFGATFGGNGNGIVTAAFVVVVFVILFGYFVLFEVLNHGRTPGKVAVGLRVLRADGGPVGFMPSAVRNLLRLVDGWDLLTLILCPIGVIAVVATEQDQRLGDLAAGTVVARERFVRTSPASVAPIGAAAANAYAEVPNPLYPPLPVPPSAPRRRGTGVGRQCRDRGRDRHRPPVPRASVLSRRQRPHPPGRRARGALRPKVSGPDASWPAEAFLEELAAAKGR